MEATTAAPTTMTKKLFKELCYHNVYTGHGVKINAFFIDWKSGVDDNGRYFCGYKCMVYSDVMNCSKSELFEIFKQWVEGTIAQVPWYVRFKYAETDVKRFKVPLGL